MMVWENLKVSSQPGSLMTGSPQRGSWWQFSPGGMSRARGLEVSILQGHMIEKEVKKEGTGLFWKWLY